MLCKDSNDLIFNKDTLLDFGISDDIDIIDIKNQQRNGRKSITVIEGLLPYKMDVKKLSKSLNKHFNVGGTCDREKGIITLQGDKRLDVKNFLLLELSIDEECIRIHGI